MRIGDVNKDNYKEYLRLFELKNTKEIEKSVDNVWRKDKEVEFDHSFEAMAAYQVKIGYAIEGMVVRQNDESWKKIVDVPDSIKQKVIDKVREHFTENGNGMVTWQQGDELASVIKGYYMTLSPSERLSASWTLEKISQAEGGRLLEYVESQMPGWKPGDPIDPDVLKAAVSGEHIDTKA